MGRRHYRGLLGRNTLLLSKNEKRFFGLIFELISLMAYIITEVCMMLWEITIFIKKRIVNHYALGKLGRSVDDIMEMVENINPRQFEYFCAELFKSTGIYSKVEVTKASHDYGRDVVLTRVIDGYEETTFVECKHWRKDEFSQIGREIAMKLLGSCATFRAEKAIIITTGSFHKNAHEIENMVDNLRLMDSLDIEKMILNLDENQLNKIIMRTMNAG